jgi:hypothetical protein
MSTKRATDAADALMRGSEVILTAPQLETLAGLIADRLTDRPRASLVGVKEAAAYLGCESSWVYEHAHELGVRRLGDGPKARLRFSLDEIDEKLRIGLASSRSEAATSVQPAGSRRRRRGSMGTTVELLPVRGQFCGESRVA